MLRLSDYANHPMVLNFWSSDCPPCVAEMPMLFQESEHYPGVQFLGIAVDEHFKARSFLLAQPVRYPQAIAPVQTDGILRRFGDRHGALPFTVVLNSAHQRCLAATGAINATWLAHALQRCGLHPPAP